MHPTILSRRAFVSVTLYDQSVHAQVRSLFVLCISYMLQKREMLLQRLAAEEARDAGSRGFQHATQRPARWVRFGSASSERQCSSARIEGDHDIKKDLAEMSESISYPKPAV